MNRRRLIQELLNLGVVNQAPEATSSRPLALTGTSLETGLETTSTEPAPHNLPEVNGVQEGSIRLVNGRNELEVSVT